MKFCFYLYWIEDGFIRNYLKCYPKFILHDFIFIYDCIKNGILLETIKNIISNLYYEIILLSMTGSRDFIRNY